MRSIRLSLIVCILALLTLALGTTSWLMYQNAEASLADRQASIRALLEANHSKHGRDELAKLDDALLADAFRLAAPSNLSRIQVKPPHPRSSLTYPLGMLTAAVNPYSHVTAPLWVAESVKGKIAWQLYLRSIGLKLDESVLPKTHELHATQLAQISTPTHLLWQSPRENAPELPLDHQLDTDSKDDSSWRPRFSDLTIADKPWRQVTLRIVPVQTKVGFFIWEAPELRFGLPKRPENERFGKGPMPWGDDGKFGKTGAPRPFQPRIGLEPEMTLYVQCCAATDERDALLARAAREHQVKLAQLDEETNAQLAELRQQLWLISGTTFLATALLGLWLVWVGLRPLARLSDAVSKVSSRDFRLGINSASLPLELQPIAARMQQTLEQLQRAFAREKQAAADISHELRTPLAAMLMNLEVGLRKTRSLEEYREILEECLLSGNHMKLLVERLLALARLDAGVDQLRPRPTDVGTLAEQCVALVRPLADARGLHIEVQPSAETDAVVDADKLREVLTNLLHNAIEYNKPNGSIAIEVGRSNGHLELAVRDTGVGISPDARQHIFERFYRADPSRHADTLHAGIGLAIVKGYVELMGGQITVDSQLGVGSTFRIDLPARPAAGASSAAIAAKKVSSV